MLASHPCPANDQPLYDLLSGDAPSSIADVIARMAAIDALLPVNDGIKWFNRLYLIVTQQVDLHPPGEGWKAPDWLLRLDVIFAQLYFDAALNFLDGRAIPSAWSVLFEARYRTGVDRIQFALAGMNAHINHDLALALLATDAELKLIQAMNSPEHADYEAVNGLLNTVMPAALTMLATDTLGVLAEDTGKIGRLLAFWNIVLRARSGVGFRESPVQPERAYARRRACLTGCHDRGGGPSHFDAKLICGRRA